MKEELRNWWTSKFQIRPLPTAWVLQVQAEWHMVVFRVLVFVHHPSTPPPPPPPPSILHSQFLMSSNRADSVTTLCKPSEYGRVGRKRSVPRLPNFLWSRLTLYRSVRSMNVCLTPNIFSKDFPVQMTLDKEIFRRVLVNLSNAKAFFVQSTRTQRFLKTI